MRRIEIGETIKWKKQVEFCQFLDFTQTAALAQVRRRENTIIRSADDLE